MQSSLTEPDLKTTVRLRIAALATLRADAATIESWRRVPIIVGTEKLPVSLLRHAEAQSLVALQTVLDARVQLGGADFSQWGVLAAPNFYGRNCIAQSLRRFGQEGAWGVSPHLIPHQSFHAVSGTISQALKMHGPNFGVGGGPNSAPDAFLLAAALMLDGTLPGLWLVLTGHTEEWIPAEQGGNPEAPPCIGIALALTAASANGSGLHLMMGGFGADAALESLAHLPLLDVSLLAEDLFNGRGMTTERWRLGKTHWLEVEQLLADAEAQS